VNTTTCVYYVLAFAGVVLFLLTLAWGLIVFIDYKLKEDKD